MCAPPRGVPLLARFPGATVETFTTDVGADWR
jgi:hypothetical protein